MADTCARVPVALRHCDSPTNPIFSNVVGEILDAAELSLRRGDVVLVKPNCLLANALACTDPAVVGAACRWLLDCGMRPRVSDSPGFGSLRRVARAIGLDTVLAALDVPFVPMQGTVWKKVQVCDREVSLPVAATSLACDRILSVPRVKVHRQMLVSLAVKNCFGCIPGLHKASIHTLFGAKPSFFAHYVAALLDILPPVSALVDGMTAMHVVGPSGGAPYPLQLLGACRVAGHIDAVVEQILGLDPRKVPLDAVVQRRPDLCQERACLVFPLDAPSSWEVRDFRFPSPLMTTSFAPHRLLVSYIRRLLSNIL